VPAEPAHRVGERLGLAILAEPQRLAVEDQVSAGKGLDERHDLRDPGGDVGEAAGIGVHDAIDPVHLQPGAIELRLDRRLPRDADRLRRRRRGARKHRQHRHTGRESDILQVRPGQCEPGRLAHISGEHGRAAYGRRRRAGRGRDGIEDDGVQRTCAHVTQEHAGEEVLLVGRGQPEQLCERGGAGGCRA
jgi:hypothetical protein